MTFEILSSLYESQGRTGALERHSLEAGFLAHRNIRRSPRSPASKTNGSQPQEATGGKHGDDIRHGLRRQFCLALPTHGLRLGHAASSPEVAGRRPVTLLPKTRRRWHKRLTASVHLQHLQRSLPLSGSHALPQSSTALEVAVARLAHLLADIRHT